MGREGRARSAASERTKSEQALVRRVSNLSQAVVQGETVDLAGQVDGKSAPTAGEQTKHILRRSDELR